jgi:hypothetical protein
MPDFDKLKKGATRRRKLDEPPVRGDTFGNLEQPEHAPAEPVPERQKSPRTAYLSLKITPDHRRKVKVLAFSEGDKEAGIVEKAIDLYFSQNPPPEGIS